MTNALRGALVALLNGVFVCLQAFHVPITGDQQAAIGGLVNGALLVYLLYRHTQTPLPPRKAP